MHRARRAYDQQLAAGISRTVAESQRTEKSNPNAYRIDQFHLWKLPEFVHEAALKPEPPTIDVTGLRAELEAWKRQREG